MAEGAGLAVELRLLAYLALLSLVIWVPYIIGATASKGMAVTVGYPSGDYSDLLGGDHGLVSCTGCVRTSKCWT